VCVFFTIKLYYILYVIHVIKEIAKILNHQNTSSDHSKSQDNSSIDENQIFFLLFFFVCSSADIYLLGRYPYYRKKITVNLMRMN